MMCKEVIMKNINRTSRLLLSVLALSIPLLSSEKMALGQERAPSSFALNSRLNDNFGSLGYLIIAIFVGSWLISIAIYRLGRFDRLEPAG